MTAKELITIDILLIIFEDEKHTAVKGKFLDTVLNGLELLKRIHLVLTMPSLQNSCKQAIIYLQINSKTEAKTVG